MPTIDRVGPYRIFFYANEWGEPPHVHVQRDASLAKFWLNPVNLDQSTEFSAHELRLIDAIVREKQSVYLEAWYAFFN